MNNKRIYQIAIELNISHSDIIDFLDGIGEKGYSHMSEVDTSIYSKIITKYSRDKKKQEIYVKEKARNTVQSNRSAEKADKDWTLSKQGRFKHSQVYLKGLSSKFGFSSHFHTIVLREEKGVEVQGILFGGLLDITL